MVPEFFSILVVFSIPWDNKLSQELQFIYGNFRSDLPFSKISVYNEIILG